MFERPRCAGRPVGAPDDFPDDTYIPKVITDRPRASARPARRRSTSARATPEIDRTPDRPGYDEQFVAISTRCMHLGCPVRYVDAAQALHLPVPRRRLRLRGQVDGGPPVRPLDRFYTRVRNGQRRDRPALLGQQRARALPAPRSRRRPLDGIGQYLYPRPLLDTQAVALTCPSSRSHHSRRRSARSPSAPARPSKPKPLDHAKEAGIAAVDWVDERTSLSGGVRWMMFRKVPKGTNWFYTLGSATMFAFLSQAVTGVFLAMYYRPVADAAPTSRSATSPTRSSSASSCAACTSGARR